MTDRSPGEKNIFEVPGWILLFASDAVLVIGLVIGFLEIPQLNFLAGFLVGISIVGNAVGIFQVVRYTRKGKNKGN